MSKSAGTNTSYPWKHANVHVPYQESWLKSIFYSRLIAVSLASWMARDIKVHRIFFFFLCGPQTSKPKCLWPYHPLQWLLELVWKGGSHIYFPKVHKYICSAGLYSITSTNKGSYQAVCTVRLFESYHFLNPAHAWNFGLMIRDRRNFFQLL